jgi:hypothetical protein
VKELIKTKRLELTGEFEGMWVEIRSNPPMRVYEDFASGEIGRVMKALATMTRGSNLTDESDQPLDLKTVDGWREVSQEFIAEVAQQIKLAMELPKANSNGSPTPSPSVAETSPLPTTS